MPDNQTIKKDAENKKHKLTPLEKCFVKICLPLAVFYSIVTVYLLNTPIDEWAFNLGQYNTQLLEVFPKVQYWVNVSVVYREKMIPLYVLYQGIIWFGFISVIIIIITKWNESTTVKHLDILNKKNKWYLLFGIIFFIFIVYGSLIYPLGTETYMLYQDLDAIGFANQIRSWNTIYGFVLFKASIILGMPGATWGAIIFSHILFLKIKHNSTNKRGQ